MPPGRKAAVPDPPALPPAAAATAAPAGAVAPPQVYNPHLVGLPPDYPVDERGQPLDPMLVDDDTQTFLLEKYGALDLDSIRANYRLADRMTDAVNNVTNSQKSWGAEDEVKYDILMRQFGRNGNTFIYLRKKKPDQHSYKSPPTALVQTYADLVQWFKNNEWDGQPVTVQWLLRDGQFQKGSGYIPLAFDPLAAIEFERRVQVARMRPINEAAGSHWSPSYGGAWGGNQGTPASLAGPPVAPQAQPSPQPVYTPPPAPPPPPAAPTATGLLTQEQLQQRLAEERAAWQRESAAQLAAERARQEAAQAQRQIEQLKADLEAMRLQGAQHDPRTAQGFQAVQQEIQRLGAALAQRTAEAPVPAPPPVGRWGGQGGGPDVAYGPPGGQGGPPVGRAPRRMPPGWRLLWDADGNEVWQEIEPKQPAAAASPPPPPPPAPAPSHRKGGLFSHVNEAVDTVIEAHDQVTQAASRLGFPVQPLFPQLGAMPAPGSHLAGPYGVDLTPASQPETPKEPEKPRLAGVIEHEGMYVRVKKDGSMDEEVGFRDLILNAGGIAGVAKTFLDSMNERETNKLRQAQLASELETKRIENKEREVALQERQVAIIERQVALTAPTSQPAPVGPAPAYEEAVVASEDILPGS